MTPPQVKVVLDDSPVHCIDVADTMGTRQFRIRPVPGGVTIASEHARSGAVWLSAEDVEELASALSRAARRHPPTEAHSA